MGATAGVDVRGGGPGTRETDALDPRNLISKIHAITFSGGSAYGLDAAGGVMRWLEEHSIGFKVGTTMSEVVPIVPAAVLFDLGRGGDFGARPDLEFGYLAADAAKGGPIAMGNVGAGTGAVAGGLRGGVGTASTRFNNGKFVAALVVVNSRGSTTDPASGKLWGAEFGLDGEFESQSRARVAIHDSIESADTHSGFSTNTTIGMVATNEPLSKAEAQKMAGVAHDGLARSIRPVHTYYDGDALFAVSTGESMTEPADYESRIYGLSRLFEAGANCVARSVAHAMLSASSHGRTPSYRSLFLDKG